jgi:hypothetical protein
MSSFAAASDSAPAPSSLAEPVNMLSGTSDCATVGGGGATAAEDFLARFFVPFAPPFFVPFLPAFFVDFVAAFFVPLPALPFFVDFLAAFLVDFLVDFLAPFRDFDFDALFFVPLPPPLRAPLDFLVPFLAAIYFTPYVYFEFRAT